MQAQLREGKAAKERADQVRALTHKDKVRALTQGHSRVCACGCTCACVLRKLIPTCVPAYAGDQGVEGAAQQVERGSAKRAIGASAHKWLA